MLKTIYLFFVIIIGSISTATSQDINSEESNKRILGDSITYSWDQANEFVNGLKNEIKLDSIYLSLQRENLNLLKSYTSLEERFFNYKDVIVPAHKAIILTKEKNLTSLNTLYQEANSLLNKQRFKKWVWATAGVLIGVLIGISL